jgi:hypothetical protein
VSFVIGFARIPGGTLNHTFALTAAIVLTLSCVSTGYARTGSTEAVADNHTACDAHRMSVPGWVTQTNRTLTNVYRFTAARSTHRLQVTNFAGEGELLLFAVVEDRCSSAGSLRLNLVNTTRIRGQTQTRLTDLTPETDYVLAVNTLRRTRRASYSMYLDMRAPRPGVQPTPTPATP